MDLFIYTLIVFVAGAIPFSEYMLAIPFGIIVGVPTTLTIIAGFLGNLITVILLIRFVDFVWEKIRKRRQRKEAASRADISAEHQGELPQNKEAAATEDDADQPAYPTGSKRTQRAKKLWDQYGLPGLTLIGTGLISSHVTVLMACLFGGNRVYIAIWMTISLAVWSLFLGVAVHFGIDIFFR